MQKPTFFAILCVSLTITAVSLGFAASRYLSIRYYVPPPPAAAADPRSVGETRSAIPPEQWTNVFAPSAGMGVPSRYDKTATGSQVPESNTRYVLLGTISSETGGTRRAILWSEGMTDPLLAREQQEIEPGLRVASIARSQVLLKRRGIVEKLELLPVGSRTREPVAAPVRVAARPQPVRTAPQPAGISIQVNKIGENAFSMDEDTVAQLTGNINQFMTQARIIPYFEGNQSAGYRLAAMRPGSAFEQLGFRAGDIIQRVNTVELTSPEKMYTIFQNLKDEKRVTVDVLRQGQKNTLTYEIR